MAGVGRGQYYYHKWVGEVTIQEYVETCAEIGEPSVKSDNKGKKATKKRPAAALERPAIAVAHRASDVAKTDKIKNRSLVLGEIRVRNTKLKQLSKNVRSRIYHDMAKPPADAGIDHKPIMPKLIDEIIVESKEK